jgi:deoxyadenosine/deoxycytidine kinase
VVISGIIGAGKTTLINLLGSRLAQEGYKIVIVKEPVEEWKTSGLLQLFYGDPARYGYTFQTEAFRSRIMTIRKVLEDNPQAEMILMERSPWDDQIFMKMLYDAGTITQLEWGLYKKWCDMWELLLPVSPDLFVLLNPPVGVCQTRVKVRGRPGEDLISDDYQTKLKECHDKFFSSGGLSSSGGGPSSLEEVEETTALIGNMLVPCYHITTQENFKDDEVVKAKVLELFKKIMSRH